MFYTFYPPLLASAWYYRGAFLLIGGSMIWVVLMIVNMAALEARQSGQTGAARHVRDHGDRAAVGVDGDSAFSSSSSGVLLPRAFGWTTLIDVALARTLFSVTLHAHCLFLADACLYRVLHIAPAGSGRSAL